MTGTRCNPRNWFAAHFHSISIWGILALEGAIWRGFTLGDMLLPCGVLVGVGVVSFAAGVRLLARADA